MLRRQSEFRSCSASDVAGWLGAAWQVRLGDPLEDAAESLSLHGVRSPQRACLAVRASVVTQAHSVGTGCGPQHPAVGVCDWQLPRWLVGVPSSSLFEPSLLLSPAPFSASCPSSRASETPRHPPCPFPWLSGEASLKTVPLHSTGRPGAPQNSMYCATQQPCGHTALGVFTRACPKGSRCFSRELSLRGPGAAHRAERH